MKKVYSLLFVMVLMFVGFLTANVYAAEKENLNPNAVYELTDSSGQPVSIQFDYTHLKYVNFPSEGDIVKIWYDGDKSKDPDEIAIYTENGQYGEGFYKQSGDKDKVYYGRIGSNGKDYDYANSTIQLRFYYSVSSKAYRYNIKQNVHVEALSPAIERLEYSISSLSVRPEDVTWTEDGFSYYTLWARERHYTDNNKLIESPFSPGESVKLYFSDGTSKTYYYKDLTTSWGLTLGGFEAEDGDVVLLDIEEPGGIIVAGLEEPIEGLKAGANDVKIVIADRNDVPPTILKVYVGASDAIKKAQITGITSKTYNGKVQKQGKLVVKLNGKTLVDKQDYTVIYKNNVNAGTATMSIIGKGNYSGSQTTRTFKINKANNPLTVKTSTKTVKKSKVKKKNQTVKAITVTSYRGKLTYTKTSGSKKLTINKTTGKITVKKGTKKGTYKIKVKVKAAGNSNYNSGSKTVTVKVKVK